MSEIDDIFASKGKSKVVPSPSISLSSLKKKKAKKAKTVSVQGDGSSSTITSASKKRPPPETVVDSSANLPSLKRQKKETGPGKVSIRKSSRSNPSEPNGDLFKDSRGSGARRTTDEGWSIYKEDELGIRDDGGDTPLCPFDCNCYLSRISWPLLSELSGSFEASPTIEPTIGRGQFVANIESFSQRPAFVVSNT